MPISASFINNFANNNPHDYYITYHQKKGFGFEKKDLNIRFLGRILAVFVRIFKRITGHSYKLEFNAKKLAEYVATEFGQISDKAPYLKGCFKVQQIVDKWLNGKDIAIIPSTQLDQAGKDTLLALYTEASDRTGMKRLIAEGADPNSQNEAIYADLEHFSEVLQEFVVLKTPAPQFKKLGPAVLLTEKDVGMDHNKNVCFSYLEKADKKSLDFTYSMHLLQLLTKFDKGRTVPITMQLLRVEAARQGCSELDLALRLNLSDIAKRMLRTGADTRNLSQPAKNALFGIYLDDKNYLMAESMIIDGVDPSCQKEKLKEFLVYAMAEENIDLARLLKRSGAANKNPEKSLLLWAVKNNRFDVVQECEQAGDSLQHSYKGGNTLLHYATEHDDLVLYDWLSTRVNVTVANEQKRTAYYYISDRREVESPAEKHFLLNSLADFFVNRLEVHAREDVAMLRAKYPASRVDHLLYTVNIDHYLNQKQVSFPQTLAPGITVDTLLSHFDSLYSDNSVDRTNLARLIRRIHEREYHLGTPHEGANLERFYHALECAITHTLKKITELEDPKKRSDCIKAFVDDLVQASRACGGRWYAIATRHYIAQIRGKEATFEDEILDLLAEFRAVTFETLSDSEGDNNVHHFNGITRALGRELGLPGMEMVEQFNDRFGQVSEYAVEQARERFKARYNPETILFDQILQHIEDNGEMRERFIDWAKSNIPRNWGNYEQIEQQALQIATREAQIAFLQEHDIFVGKNQTIQDAVKEELIDQYMEKEVVVDRYATTMRLQPQAIARMLHRIGVITPVYYVAP